MTPLSIMLLVVALIFGGSGATVASAQSSLPGQPLYQVKLLSEDVRLDLATNTQTQYQLVMQFAATRAEEMSAMVAAGNAPTEAVQTRYQDQVEQAIQLAAGMEDAQAVQALEQILSRLQTQQQMLIQAGANASPNAQAVLEQTQQMIQERLRLVEEGIVDPAQLRVRLNQQGNGMPENQGNEAGNPSMGGGNPWTDGTPTPGSGYGPGAGDGTCQDCTPVGTGMGSGSGANNPWTTGTPTPGSGYGPGTGDGTCQTCTPAGTGTGMGNGNPYTTGTPTPGSSYGPGPGDGTGMTNTPSGTGSGAGTGTGSGTGTGTGSGSGGGNSQMTEMPTMGSGNDQGSGGMKP